MTPLALFLGLCLAGPAAPAGDAPFSLADFDAYRAALAAAPDPAAPPVRFRDLWDRPGAFSGRPVRVRGRLARRFRQAGVGEFPALVEDWIVSEADEPFCLVYPAIEGRPTPPLHANVRFSGTFLRRIRYPGGDGDRVAPLVVGSRAPTVESGPGPDLGGPSWSAAEWAMGLAAASMVATVLVRRHLARPSPALAPIGPPPRFLDGDPGPIDEEGDPDVDDR